MKNRMTTKEKLLAMLEENKGQWLSGEKIGEAISVSRMAVWKAAAGLRNEGYCIDAVRKKGYRLSEETDMLSGLGIWKYLPPDCGFLNIRILEEVGSTNAALWEQARTGSPEGTVLIAASQTDGRGRLGRRFYSPSDTGIYMSILLRPVKYSPEQTLRLTTLAAVAVCEAIEDVSGKRAGIKWVNDIFIGDRKVCGILTEGSVSMESGRIDAVILGVGMNVYAPEGGFPEDLKDLAGAILDERVSDGKNRLAAAFLERFFSRYRSGGLTDHGEAYRSRSIVVGREIRVDPEMGGKKALVLDVDEDCRLAVRYEDGRTERLSAGEISIRLQDGNE